MEYFSCNPRNPRGRYVEIPELFDFFGARTFQNFGNDLFEENIVAAKWQKRLGEKELQVVFRNLTFKTPEDLLAFCPALEKLIRDHLSEIEPRKEEIPDDPEADACMEKTWQVKADGSFIGVVET